MARRHAICIGIDTYRDADIPPLDNCAADASGIADYLSLPEFEFTTEVIVNADATRARILRELGGALQNPPDFLIFYFSGHGIVTDFGPFLVTHDSAEFDEGIPLEQLSGLIQRASEVIPHCLILLDCCHSGAGDVSLTHRLISAADLESGVATRTESRVLLAACRPEQLSEEDDQYGHGIFTYAIIKGLAGEAADADGVITVGGLAESALRTLEGISAEQIMVNKGAYAGRIVLATGLPPVARRSIPQEHRRRVIGEGRQFMDDYTSQLNSSLDDWKAAGHLAATQALAPTLRWFERQREEYSELKTDREFGELYEAAINRVKQLAEVDTNTVTAEGTISKRVGGGGFGTVWKVDQAESGISLAYKIYHPADYTLGEKRRLFFRGYRAMQQLDHPRVVKVRGYTECPVGFYMDYVDGPSLRDLSNTIEDGDEIVRFLILIAETIAHAHSRGVIHRDIKPENILAEYVPDDGKWLPFLTDFDLAWFSQATQVTKHAWGNLSYAAPEQLAAPRSRAAHDTAVDIYAFGQLAFFAITGSDPTPIGHADNNRALRERLERWRSASAAEHFLAWYERCTDTDPRQRFTDFISAMDGLFEIESMFRDESELLSLEGVVRELAFSLSGFSASGAADDTFPSTSGRTNIALRAESAGQNATRVSIVATLTLDRIWIETTSNERGRALLNGRITEVLKPFNNAKREPGTHGTFSTHIHVVGIEANRNGVEEVRTIVRRVLDVIER